MVLPVAVTGHRSVPPFIRKYLHSESGRGSQQENYNNWDHSGMTLCPLFLLKLLMTKFTGEWTPQHQRGRGNSAEPGGQSGQRIIFKYLEFYFILIVPNSKNMIENYNFLISLLLTIIY